MNEIKLSAQQQKIIDYMEAHDGHITNREIMETSANGARYARYSLERVS